MGVRTPSIPFESNVGLGWKMEATRGKNLIAVAWRDGVLRCAFASKDGARFYLYPGVPEAEKLKLLRSPYPDGLWSKLKKKYSLKGEKEAA